MLATNSNSVNARLREREEWGLNRRDSKHFGMHFQIFKTPQQAKQNTQSGYIQLCKPAFVIFDFYKHRTGNPKDGPIITISFSLLLETSVRLGVADFPSFPNVQPRLTHSRVPAPTLSRRHCRWLQRVPVSRQ